MSYGEIRAEHEQPPLTLEQTLHKLSRMFGGLKCREPEPCRYGAGTCLTHRGTP